MAEPHRSSQTKHFPDHKFSSKVHYHHGATKSQSQSERLRMRPSRPTRKRPKSPVLSLAERIVIARLDPRNFSMQTTKLAEVQKAVSMTPRPSLSDLIKQYRQLHDSEQDLGQSMIDQVRETQDHIKTVESDLQQLIISQKEGKRDWGEPMIKEVREESELQQPIISQREGWRNWGQPMTEEVREESELQQPILSQREGQRDWSQPMTDKVREEQISMDRVEIDSRQRIQPQGEEPDDLFNRSAARMNVQRNHDTRISEDEAELQYYKAERPNRETPVARNHSNEEYDPKGQSVDCVKLKEKLLKLFSGIDPKNTDNAVAHAHNTTAEPEHETTGDKLLFLDDSPAHKEVPKVMHNSTDVQLMETAEKSIPQKGHTEMTDETGVMDLPGPRNVIEVTSLPKLQDCRTCTSHTGQKQVVHINEPSPINLPAVGRSSEEGANRNEEAEYGISADDAQARLVDSHRNTLPVVTSPRGQTANDNLSGDQPRTGIVLTYNQHTDSDSKAGSRDGSAVNSDRSVTVGLQHSVKSGMVVKLYADPVKFHTDKKEETLPSQNLVTTHDKKELEEKSIFQRHGVEERAGKSSHRTKNAEVQISQEEDQYTDTAHISNIPHGKVAVRPNEYLTGPSLELMKEKELNCLDGWHNDDKESTNPETHVGLPSETKFPTGKASEVTVTSRTTSYNSTTPTNNELSRKERQDNSSPELDTDPKAMVPDSDKALVIINHCHRTTGQPQLQSHIKADINRFHLASEADKEMGLRRRETITAKEKEKENRSKADEEDDEQISIKINARGDVHISTYTEKKKKVIEHSKGSNPTAEEDCRPGFTNGFSDKNSSQPEEENRFHSDKANAKSVKAPDTFDGKIPSLKTENGNAKELRQPGTRGIITGCKNQVLLLQCDSNFDGVHAAISSENKHETMTQHPDQEDLRHLARRHQNEPRILPAPNEIVPTLHNSQSHCIPRTTDLANNLSDNDDDGDDDDDDDDDNYEDNEDDDDADDRIYDFIGIPHKRSYTLPELISKNSLSRPNINPSYRQSVDTHASREWFRNSYNNNNNNDNKTVLPTLIIPRTHHVHHHQMSVLSSSGKGVKASPSSSEQHLPLINGPGVTMTPFTRSKGDPGSNDLRYVRLPRLTKPGENVTKRMRKADQTATALSGEGNRQQRIRGLYQDLKDVNVFCPRPSTLRLNLSKPASDVDMHIEWEQPLPKGETTAVRIKYRSVRKSLSGKGKQKATDHNVVIKLPNTKSRKGARKRFRRNFSQAFIFLDDDVFPQMELRHNGEGFCPDVTWFLQQGVASECCDAGFSAGRERKSKAWTTLRNRCLPRVHIMRALETKTFGLAPTLKLKPANGKT